MFAKLGLAALAVAQTAVAIPTLSAYGSKLFTSDGNQFFIKGMYTRAWLGADIAIVGC